MGRRKNVETYGALIDGPAIAAARKVPRKGYPKGLSQQDLAMLLGVVVATVSKWERGEIERITPVNLAALASKLRVPRESLVFPRQIPAKRKSPRTA